MLDEARLAEPLDAIAAGRRAATGERYGLIGGRLSGIAQRILRGGGLAEDAAKGRAFIWMGVIVRRAALDGRPKPSTLLLPELEAPNIDMNHVHPRLRECLEELPVLHRNALVLIHVYGLSHSELAERMDAPLGTVKSWVRRASAALKEKLER
jgi:RNA polymerase sigma-70 factor (ECF subfamily)